MREWMMCVDDLRCQDRLNDTLEKCIDVFAFASVERIVLGTVNTVVFQLVFQKPECRILFFVECG